MKAEIYWNLHRKCWSVRENGRVVDHCTSLGVTAAKLVVQPAGRERVRRENKKNVHAFVRGNAGQFSGNTRRPNIESDWVEVTYNPYKHDTFVERDTGKPVRYARKIIMSSRDGKPAVWVAKEGLR